RPTTRRQFLIRAGVVVGTLSGADALLSACGGAANSAATTTGTNGVLMGPGGIPLARRDHPVTLPIYSDNHAIASGKDVEAGPLNLFNWDAYINPATVKAFEKEFKVKVSLTTFENEEEAIAKLTSGQNKFDVWWTTVDYVSRAVAGKLIQPINHSYLPNLKNVWTSLQSPYYDQHSRYTVPYATYTTGIAWRTDKLKKAPPDYANPYDIFWDSHRYSGKVAILDDQREALGMTLLRRKFYDINTEDPKQINRAEKDLSQLTSIANVKVNVNDYTDIPTGKTYISQAWSGDIAGAPYYLPKGVPASVLGYWRPDDHAETQNDMIAILKTAQHPVLAHAFLNFMLDNKNGIDNFSWNGYIPPLTAIDPNKLIAQGYIPKNLASTIVRKSDFDKGVTIDALTSQGQALWQDAWSTFKAG
ncbi:MAG: ABC transporter substrate-binding protein, partial [Curtobacterium sp.]